MYPRGVLRGGGAPVKRGREDPLYGVVVAVYW